MIADAAYQWLMGTPKGGRKPPSTACIKLPRLTERQSTIKELHLRREDATKYAKVREIRGHTYLKTWRLGRSRQTPGLTTNAKESFAKMYTKVLPEAVLQENPTSL